MEEKHEKFIQIILKPLYYVTTDELKWVIRCKDAKPYKRLFKEELRKRKRKRKIELV